MIEGKNCCWTITRLDSSNNCIQLIHVSIFLVNRYLTCIIVAKQGKVNVSLPYRYAFRLNMRTVFKRFLPSSCVNFYIDNTNLASNRDHPMVYPILIPGSFEKNERWYLA